MKYEKEIAIPKDSLPSDYQYTTTSYLWAKELGIQTLMQTSSVALKYVTQVGKTEFNIDLKPDLKAERDLNAIKVARKNRQRS